MEPFNVCTQETKYTCVWCRQIVCFLSVVEETPGYNEETYSIGRCPEGKCCDVEDGENVYVTIVGEKLTVRECDGILHIKWVKGGKENDWKSWEFDWK